ncbi:MAG: hypothetical protein KDI61_02330 [Alphaproteobacteria bacterium]|nr:hypothetical protein [Alphaproteobacteria bacterium]
MKRRNPPETLRAVFRTIPDGLELRKAPSALIDQEVLLYVFGPAKRLLDQPAEPSPDKPVRKRPH